MLIHMDTNNISEPIKISNSVHAPEYAPVKENEMVLMSLGLNADHIAALPMIVNTGDAFLLLEVKKAEVLKSLQPEANNMRHLSDQYGLSGFCIFLQGGENADASCRIFMPLPGGSPDEGTRKLAAGALACYLYDIAMIKKDLIVVKQGFYSKPPNPMTVHVKLTLLDGKIQSWDATSRSSIA